MQVGVVSATEDQSYWKPSEEYLQRLFHWKIGKQKTLPALTGCQSFLRVLNSWHSWAILGAGWESFCSSRENPWAKVEKGEIQGYLWWKAVSLCVDTVHCRHGEPSSRPRRYGTQTVSVEQLGRGPLILHYLCKTGTNHL